MPTAPANGIEICYDTFGQPANPALLLVMGLGGQMTAWEPDFCEALANAGFHVIRFDNRDTGLSTKMESAPPPDIGKAMTGDMSSASYTLWDMADDAVGLLDHLQLERAHIVGASMGGMIVQAIAIRHPHRVISMTSIMSTTGNPNVGQATPAAMTALMAPPATSRDEAIERGKQSARIVGSPGYPAGDEVVAARIARDFDRCFYPIGVARQMLAVMATGDRSEALNTVTAPTLVIHGEDDPLVTLSGGQATAAAIPGARLVTFPGMGHDLPASLRAKFVEVIAGHAASVPG
ncbi:MAG: alpha/beta hydrolase [Dehalococcoidia bacterium]|uniref:alpha/beta fold hydrolase n=1 Tax=Candidatus Amarobacter glycogenicus TaxID=3140699 RepID=UPI003135D98F|nr:alpha/beta hydrolase [Dehalococcoidia bacterium]MBK7328087.1 alpha/beta hydrolase [Dehalococcoidia bacterium]MBK8561319.1 alpha/beta hydrolase [Dehalococcoidia bacterium]MCC6266183.1 alpha/beta hydrolase [Dehalococcoidia bacterium]